MKEMLREIVMHDRDGTPTLYSNVGGTNPLAKGLIDAGLAYRTTEVMEFHYCLRPTKEGRRRIVLPHNSD